jgi:hypothetical protein
LPTIRSSSAFLGDMQKLNVDNYRVSQPSMASTGHHRCVRHPTERKLLKTTIPEGLPLAVTLRPTQIAARHVLIASKTFGDVVFS